VGRFHVLETPLALDRYKQASTELLTMLDQVVYPALREDPANESGKYPIRFRPGGFTSEIETPGGGLHYLVYQVIEELGRVLVLDLVTFREPWAPVRRSARLITDGSRSSPQPAALRAAHHPRPDAL
jgi:hypothetical protein